MNIGTNPTTDTDLKLKAEVNIFNFNEDIYGTEIEVSFLDRIRNEEKFESLQELINAIKKDEIKCKELALNI